MTSGIDRHQQPSRLFQVLYVLAAVAVLAAAFSYAFVPLRGSQDEWWHLKTGKWIVENGRLPQNDIFTYTGENLRWHNHEWLSQVIFYKVYDWGSDKAIGAVRALITFKSLVVVITFALVAMLARLRSARWGVALLVALLAAEVSRRTIYARPPIFSYLLFTFWLIALYQWKSGRLRMLWLWVALPPLMVLWANLHGMCLLGIVAVGSFSAGQFVEDFRRYYKSNCPLTKFLSPQFWSLVLLTAIVVAAAMASPAGYNTFFLGSKFTNDPLLKEVILEMLPPPLPLQPGPDGEWHFVPGFVTFWVVAGIFLVLLVANRFRMPVGADYFLSFFFLYQGVMHWRLLPLFAIASAGPLSYLIAARLYRIRSSRAAFADAVFAGIAVLLAAYYVFMVPEPPPQTFFRRNMQLLRGHTMSPADYPEPLMRFLIDANLPPRMLSESNYCGYFIWRLSPEHYKLFTDNRFDLFGSKYYELETVVLRALGKGDHVGNLTAQTGWRNVLDEWGVNFVVVTLGRELNDALAREGWAKIYQYRPPGAAASHGWNVWLRNSPEFAEDRDRALTVARTLGAI